MQETISNMLYQPTGSVGTTATISTRPKKRRRLFIAAASEPQPTDKADIAMTSTLQVDSQNSEEPLPMKQVTSLHAPPVNLALRAVKQAPASRNASSESDFRSSTALIKKSVKTVMAFDNDFRTNRNCRIDLTIDEFLAEYVDCQDGLSDPSPMDTTRFFAPLAGPSSEKAMYTPLITGLTKLVEDFPDDRKPHFEKTDRTRFRPVHQSFHITFPDLCNGFPGAGSGPICVWDQVACVWEAKLRETQDPIDSVGLCKDGFEHQKTRVQLEKNGLNLLKQHKSCFVFIIGIYGPTFRIFRFDRAGVISSVSANYVSSPQILRKFLWRLVHPRKAIPSTIVGWDPTIRRVTDQEFERMFRLLLKFAPQLTDRRWEVKKRAFWTTACAMPEGRLATCSVPAYDGDSVTIPPHHRLTRVPFTRVPNQGIAVECFAFETLHSSNGLFSRASAVYKVLVDHDEFREQIYVLKDSWQERTRIDEGYYYERIETHLQDSRVQKMIQDELGDLIPKDNVSGLTDYVGTYNLSLYDGGGEQYGLVTKSGRLTLAASQTTDPSDFDRDRIRTLTGCVGGHITNFESTKQLVTALRDVVIGLAIADYCGVVHRDVSVGNVLLHEHKFGGFLHDFDYAAVRISVADPEPEQFKDYIDKGIKDMTGTWPFMALGILNEVKEGHCLGHDLESVYWVLIWCLLRHAKHEHRKGDQAAKWLFDDPSPDHRYATKFEWVNKHPLVLTGKVPLTTMLGRLRMLIKDCANAEEGTDADKILTPRAMLKVMNEALLEKDWSPINDASTAYSVSLSATVQARKEIKEENRLVSEGPLSGSLQGGSGSRGGDRRSKSTPSDGHPGLGDVLPSASSLNSSKRKRATPHPFSNKAGRSLNLSPLNTHEGTEP